MRRKTMWKHDWRPTQVLTTEKAGARELTDVGGGVSEMALRVAENTAEALARLVATLEGKGLLHHSEVQSVLGLYGYTYEEENDAP